MLHLHTHAGLQVLDGGGLHGHPPRLILRRALEYAPALFVLKHELERNGRRGQRYQHRH
jgi:hypothetical protein